MLVRSGWHIQRMSLFWRDPKKLFSLLQVGKNYFKQPLRDVRIATLEKTDYSLIPLNFLSCHCQMASLVSPNLIAIFSPLAAGQGMAICGTDRVNKDEVIIFTANCAAMGQQRC